MAVYFGDDAEFALENGAIKLTSNSNKGIAFNSYGLYNNPNRPYFIAQNTAGGTWTNFTSAAWNTLVIGSTIVNNGNHYSTSNGRFTAPTTGIYYVCHHAYVRKVDNTSSTYTHPLFRVNGSTTVRQSSTTTPYRLRNRTYSNGGFVADTSLSEVFHLNSGDYVTVSIYCSSTFQWHAAYTMFQGIFIG